MKIKVLTGLSKIGHDDDRCDVFSSAALNRLLKHRLPCFVFCFLMDSLKNFLKEEEEILLSPVHRRPMLLS